MALPHAILVALCEQAGSGYELASRFDRSIGYFWAATHQQIYKTLRAMDADGWVSVEVVAQHGRPDKKVYSVTAAGRADYEALQRTFTARADLLRTQLIALCDRLLA